MSTREQHKSIQVHEERLKLGGHEQKSPRVRWSEIQEGGGLEDLRSWIPKDEDRGPEDKDTEDKIWGEWANRTWEKSQVPDVHTSGKGGGGEGVHVGVYTNAFYHQLQLTACSWISLL